MRRPRGGVPETARTLGGLVLALGATAALLRAVDALPDLLQGRPRGVAALDSLAELRAAGVHSLLLPAYFPDTFAWPPRRVLLARGAPRAVGLRLEGREGSQAELWLYQTLDDEAAIPARLRPPATPFHRLPLAWADGTATLARLKLDGRVWEELELTTRGRRVVLRFRGGLPTPELLRLARSLRPARP